MNRAKTNNRSVSDYSIALNAYALIPHYYNNLGLSWKAKGDPDKAITYLEKALQINLKLFGEKT